MKMMRPVLPVTLDYDNTNQIDKPKEEKHHQWHWTLQRISFGHQRNHQKVGDVLFIYHEECIASTGERGRIFVKCLTYPESEEAKHFFAYSRVYMAQEVRCNGSKQCTALPIKLLLTERSSLHCGNQRMQYTHGSESSRQPRVLRTFIQMTVMPAMTVNY